MATRQSHIRPFGYLKTTCFSVRMLYRCLLSSAFIVQDFIR